MADHTLDMLRSSIRAMNEVVLPAVDRSHPLALEQATLVTKILQLVADRLPAWPQRLRAELEQQRGLAEVLAPDAAAVSPAIAQALAQAAQRADALLAAQEAQPLLWQQCARELGGLAGALVQAAQGGDVALRQRVEHAVVAAADPFLALQRSWFLPQGWEPDASVVPPLETLLPTGIPVATP
jgi:hypothetical protein